MTDLSSRRPHRHALFVPAWSLGGVLSLCAALGCHPSPAGIKGTRDIAGVETLEEAQAIVDEARSEHGGVDEGPRPASLSECAEILRRDQSQRFAAARDYLSSLDGLEPLALRARLEAAWTEGQFVVADLARERARRLDRDITAMRQTLKLHPDDDRLRDRVDEAQRQADHERRLAQALSKLSEPHYEAALSLAREVIRRDRQRADGFGTLANLYRLREEWGEFERSLAKAEALGGDLVDLQYARAMALAERSGDRDGAKKALEALLAEHPDIARARARLVLLEDSIRERHDQLKQLAQINPKHALILLEGNAVEREYEVARGAAE